MSNMIDQAAISTIIGGATSQGGYQPTVQVLSIKKMGASGSSNERWRLVLSDGRHFAQSMLATQQSEFITSGELRELCLITLTEFIVNNVQNKKLVIVLKLDVKSGPVAKIGSPINVADDPNAGNDSNPMQGKQSNTGAYGGGMKSNTGAYGADVKPKVPGNPYGAPAKQAQNPYGGGGGGNYGGGGGYSGGGGGGGRRGGGASNPYANRGSSNSGPVQRQSQDNVYVPISALNPYQNRWTIKARVTKKGDMRTWSNAKGEGNLFSVDLLDENGSEIRGTFFKLDADKWFDVLQEGSVYNFCGGRIKVASKQFSSLNSEYEITFDQSTDIVEIGGDSRIMNMIYSFVKLNQMEQMEPNTIIDVIAVVKSVDDCVSLTTRAGKETNKRNLYLVDDTCTEISLTLWGSTAAEDGSRWEGNPVVAFKGVKLSDFSGRSLSSFNSSSLTNNPDVPETRELQEWFASAGGGSSFKSVSVRSGGGGSDEIAKRDISSRYTLESIRESNLGHGEKPDYAMVKATISFIKVDMDKEPWYTACPVEGCNKKVIETVEGGWQCEKCNRTHENCRRRFILNMTVSDHTGRVWVTAFNDVAEPLLNGKTADELYELKESGEGPAYEDAFAEACFQSYMVTLRIKAEMVNDEMRLKNTIQRMTPVDIKTEGNALLSAISKYN